MVDSRTSGLNGLLDNLDVALETENLIKFFFEARRSIYMEGIKFYNRRFSSDLRARKDSCASC